MSGSTGGGARRPAARTYRRPKPDAPRRAAFDTLRAVRVDDAYANLVLPGLLRDRGIEGRDAAFATELAYGTLRLSGTYDRVIEACVDRPLDAVDGEVLDVLRLGAHQLLAMRVPDHAAVGETVELARATVGDGRAKFVNAVLRKVGARDLEDWLVELAPSVESDPVGHLAVVHAHPAWVVRAFAESLGVDPADPDGRTELTGLLAADNEPPTVTLVARPGRSTADDLQALGAVPGRWSPLAGTLASGDPAAFEAVRRGDVGVQDEGSQLVALAVAAATLEPAGGPDLRWLDLCAGPGGKAALLAGLAEARGARLTANEPQPHRAELVRRAVGARVEVVVGDGRAGPWDDASFDRVLVDAPCTGLGALRRRPEARWRRQPADVDRLVVLQRSLLGAAADAVRPGGVVAYVTCSPVLAESRGVVDSVIAGRHDLERLDARGPLAAVAPSIGDLGPGPDVQLWPHRHGTDAMFLSLVRRIG